MAIYKKDCERNQCGGVANDFTGKVCADVKVQANVGFAKCEFSFRADGTSCGGAERQKVIVNKGEDSNGAEQSEDSRFFALNCF